MEIKGDIIGIFLSGQPVKIKDCNIFVVQPTITDIVLFGEDDFLTGINILTDTEKVFKDVRLGNSQLDIFSDFQLLLVILKQEPTIHDLVTRLFEILFPNYQIEITDASLDFYVQQEEKRRLVGRVTNFNCENFQKIIKSLFLPIGDDKDYNPANEAASAIAEKLRKGRERKNQLNAQREGAQSLFGRYASILSIGMQMDINIFFKYTPFQLYDAFTRYFAKVNSDLYTKISTTPLMDVSNMETPEEWVRNLY